MVPCCSPGCEPWIRRLLQNLQKKSSPFHDLIRIHHPFPFSPPPVSRTMDLRKPLGSLSAFHCMLLTDIDEEVTGMTARLVLVSVGNMPAPNSFVAILRLLHRRLASIRLSPFPPSKFEFIVGHHLSPTHWVLQQRPTSLYPPTCYRLYSLLFPLSLPHCRASSPLMYLSFPTMYFLSLSPSFSGPSPSFPPRRVPSPVPLIPHLYSLSIPPHPVPSSLLYLHSRPCI